MAAPMPLEAPVTSATLPDNMSIGTYTRCSLRRQTRACPPDCPCTRLNYRFDGRTPACQEVLAVVSALSGISIDALLGPSRARAVSRVRSVALHLPRTEDGGLRVEEIACLAWRDLQERM